MAIQTDAIVPITDPDMDIGAIFSEYGLLALFLGVFIEQLGAPIPALPFLMLAGAAGADDGMFVVKAVLVAVVASMLADTLWYFAGRRYGRRVLTLLCRISISPVTCVRQSELSFGRWGVATLVVAKFVPGLSTLAPPLSGSLGMRPATFLLFNLAGSTLWAGSGIAGGLIFHNQIAGLLDYLSGLGSIALSVLLVLLALYVTFRLVRRWRMKRQLARLPRVLPQELADLIARGNALMILDVRGAALHDPQAGRIPGARHLELGAMDSVDTTGWEAHAEIITYCACPNDVSALKAAQLLARRGWRVRALAGGIDGWAAAGYALEVAG